MDKKKISRKGYRVLAVVWTLAAASMAAAFVRRLPQFSPLLFLLLALSVLTAANFWRAYKRAPEVRGAADPFEHPPRFADNPVLFDGDPPSPGGGPGLTEDPNKTLEEKDYE